MAAIPRGKSPSTLDIETGQKVFVPKVESPSIEVVVDKPVPTQKQRTPLTGREVLSKAIGPGYIASYRAGKKKTRKQKRHARKTKKHLRKK